MVKLIQETDIFKIQLSRGSVKGSKFVDLFIKDFAIMNAGVLLKNYKKCTKGNWSQSKNDSNLFKSNKNNADVKKIDKITLHAKYNSDNI